MKVLTSEAKQYNLTYPTNKKSLYHVSLYLLFFKFNATGTIAK